MIPSIPTTEAVSANIGAENSQPLSSSQVLDRFLQAESQKPRVDQRPPQNTVAIGAKFEQLLSNHITWQQKNIPAGAFIDKEFEGWVAPFEGPSFESMDATAQMLMKYGIHTVNGVARLITESPKSITPTIKRWIGTRSYNLTKQQILNLPLMILFSETHLVEGQTPDGNHRGPVIAIAVNNGILKPADLIPCIIGHVSLPIWLCYNYAQDVAARIALRQLNPELLVSLYQARGISLTSASYYEQVEKGRRLFG